MEALEGETQESWRGTNSMRRLSLTFAVIFALAGTLSAAVLEIESTQVGGFNDDGTADNSPTFQNYFVGHTGLFVGGSPVLGPERRCGTQADLSV